MNILIFAESIAKNTGGARTGILAMAQGLANNGNSIDLYVTTIGEEGNLELSSKNLRIRYFNCQFSILEVLYRA